jgi:hypothetical protein
LYSCDPNTRENKLRKNDLFCSFYFKFISPWMLWAKHDGVAEVSGKKRAVHLMAGRKQRKGQEGGQEGAMARYNLQGHTPSDPHL